MTAARSPKLSFAGETVECDQAIRLGIIYGHDLLDAAFEARPRSSVRRPVRVVRVAVRDTFALVRAEHHRMSAEIGGGRFERVRRQRLAVPTGT